MFHCVTRKNAMFLVTRPMSLLGHRLQKAKNFCTTSSVEKTKALINDPLSPYDSSSNNKEKSCSPIASCDCSSGSYRTCLQLTTDSRLDSFSKFSETLTHANQKYYTSEIFDVGGYKWKLSLYPNGNEKGNGKGHLSMFLNIAETNKLPLGWEANAIYRFFVLDQIRDKFLTIQDSLGKSCRFDAMKTESGIPQLLPLSEFEDSRNGFLVEDKCTFGAEILLICNTHDGERIMPVEGFRPFKHRWVIEEVSELTEQPYFSEPFTAGNFKWELEFHPDDENNSIGLYFKAIDLDSWDKLHVQFKLAIEGPSGVQHHTRRLTCCFTSESEAPGYEIFLSWEEFNSPSKGYVVDDSTVISAEITNIFTIQSLY